MLALDPSPEAPDELPERSDGPSQGSAARYQTAMRVFQYHPSIAPSDAIGGSIRILDQMLKQAGIASLMLCRDSELGQSTDSVMPISAFYKLSWTASDILIVHYSFFDEILDQILDLPVKKIFVYHNVTPSAFFQRDGMHWLAAASDASRVQIRTIAKSFVAAVGVSQFNCEELTQIGCANIEPIPVFFHGEALSSAEFDKRFFYELKRSAAVNLLFIGRFVPNKRHDLLIAIASRYKVMFGRKVKLHLVGKIWSEHYLNDLLKSALDQNVLMDIQIHNDAPFAKVKALLKAADAFICMSEHEGFMVPVLEAFCAGCPVIAYGGSAVGETMGGAGLTLPVRDPEMAAGLVELLRVDKRARNDVIRAQAARAADFSSEKTFATWMRLLGRHVSIRELA